MAIYVSLSRQIHDRTEQSAASEDSNAKKLRSSCFGAVMVRVWTGQLSCQIHDRTEQSAAAEDSNAKKLRSSCFGAAIVSL